MKYDLNFDYDNETYKRIFSDTSRPFSERLDKAVELANEIVKNKMKIRSILITFANTGIIFIDSSIRNPNQTT